MIKKVIKKIINILDSKLPTNFYKRAVRLQENWYNLSFLNIIRRNINFIKIKLKYGLGVKRKKLLKLHLGCGSHHFKDYINIDRTKTKATDVVSDIRKLPYPENSIELIECYHTLEHLPVCLMANLNSSLGKKYALLINTLKKWQEILKPGGKLIIEVPDFDKTVGEYVKSDNNRKGELIVYMYGGYRNNNIFDIHRWGPNEYRLRYILEKAGFKEIKFKEAQDYHKEFCPCLRVECKK